MAEKLAIRGGTPVFGGRSVREYFPQWPIAYPEIEEKLIEVYRSGKWGMNGPCELQLMEEFARYQGTRHSIWMSNGTVTLECALLALGIEPGDEVIVPGITWLATAEAAIYLKAVPVIVDVDPVTMCMDPAAFEAAITPRTRAVIPVHVYSGLADMPEILAIARRHGLAVIEDCAHAQGARQQGKGVGSFGAIGSFSFQLTKLMTAGEGGCCTTGDDGLADRIFRLSHIGNSLVEPKVAPDPSLICRQYRFTEFQAAILLGQLAHQPELHAQRRAAFAFFREALKGVPGIRLQESAYADDEPGHYYFTMLLDPERLHEGIDRAAVREALRAEGFDYLSFGWGAPLYGNRLWNIPEKLYVKRETPVSERLMYRQVMTCGHQFLLGSREGLELAAAALRKVMTAYAD